MLLSGLSGLSKQFGCAELVGHQTDLFRWFLYYSVSNHKGVWRVQLMTGRVEMVSATAYGCF